MPLSFQQKQSFKSQPEQVVEDFKFDGGLVTDIHETKLQQNQSPNLGDVIRDTTGNLLTRNGYLRYNVNPVGATSDEANTGASTGTQSLITINDYIAQTFQLTPSVDITQVDLYLAMNTTGETQYVQVELWSGATGPNAVLADAQTKLISGTSETTYSFRFRVPYTLAATTEYAIVLKPVIVQSTSQLIKTVKVHRTGNAYASGAAYSSSDAGITWGAIATTDLKFNVYTGGSTGSTGLVRFYGDNGIQQSLAKFGTGLYRGDDVTGVMSTITMGNSITPVAANYLDYTVSNGTLLVTDDSNYILKYRGSTNAAYSTGTLTVTNGSATVTGSGTTWDTTTNAEVGEYIKLPDSKWYKITAIGGATSITIESTYYGSTLAGQTYIISPWGVVQGRFNSGGTSPTSESIGSLVKPTPSYIENHINRIWTLEGNSLRFSVLDTSITGEHFNDWDTGGNAGQIIIPSGNGDTGTGLYSLSNSLYVFQRRAIWRLYGSSPANFELRNVTNEIGMISNRTLVEWNDLLIFLSDFGLYLFDGSNLKNISEGVVNTLIDSWANKTSPVATLWDNKYVISYTPSGGTVNTTALFFDLQAQTFWKINNLYASAWMSWAGGTDDGRLYFGSSNQGSIYRWDTGSHDDGYVIESLYDTPSLSFGSGMNDKSLKRFYLQQLSVGDWNMQTTMLTNVSEDTTSGSAINLSPGSAALWGVFQWGVDEWSGEGALVTTRLAEFQGQGRYFKFRFEQTGYAEGFEILGIVATARLRRLN
jgi:hypothetical protein